MVSARRSLHVALVEIEDTVVSNKRQLVFGHTVALQLVCGARIDAEWKLTQILLHALLWSPAQPVVLRKHKENDDASNGHAEQITKQPLLKIHTARILHSLQPKPNLFTLLRHAGTWR